MKTIEEAAKGLPENKGLLMSSTMQIAEVSFMSGAAFAQRGIPIEEELPKVKGIVIKSRNNSGEKCKTYIFDCGNNLVFHKYTLVKPNEFESMIGGETIIKTTERYMLTFHRFSIKKSTLRESIIELGLLL